MIADRKKYISNLYEGLRLLANYSDTHIDIDEQYEISKQNILAADNLAEDEKSELMHLLNNDYDKYKIRYNIGKKRTCEICKNECLATLYCEHCIRNYLKAN